MDYDRAMGADGSNEEEVDWMDTNWDKVESTVQTRGRSMKSDGSTETQADSCEDKREDKNSPLMSRMQLNDYKAGMQGLDKDHINQVIYEVSKGSRFFENERRKEEQVRQRIEAQEQRRREISDAELERGNIEADILIAQLASSRDLSQTIVHVDMDAFYAAVEMRDNPSLRDKPMAVGGIGMLSTSNYEARKYGVRAAMPGFIGRKLCPQLVIVPANFPCYKEICNQVRQIFSHYDPNFCPMSLDEAYLNFTEHLAKRQTASLSERLVIRRCQTPADPAFCCCDLNSTIRNILLKKGVFDDGTCSGDVGVHSNTDKLEKKDAVGKEEKAVLGEDSFEKASVSSLTGVSNTSSTKCDDSLEAQSSGNFSVRMEDSLFECIVPSAAKVHCLEAGVQSSLVESCAQIKDPSRVLPDSAGELKVKSVEIGSPCPVCDKPIPQYEMAVFGLDIESAVREMRCRIEQRTCLTASAGIAPNMMLSKVCSDQNKPNGQFFLSPHQDDVMQFVHNLPIRKISGIGRVTEQLLGVLGITACKDLFEQRALLYHLYSPVSFAYFMRVTCGIGSTQVASAREEERKSMSTEQTFGELSQPEELYAKCLELCHSLAEDLAKEELVGKTVSLKLKTTDFQVRTRAQTMSTYTRDAEVFFAVAKAILRSEILAESPKPLRLRLMGVRMSKLVAGGSCLQEKQDTILGFFKKTSSSISQTSSMCEQRHKAASASAGKDSVHVDVTDETSTADFIRVGARNQQDHQGRITWAEQTDESHEDVTLQGDVHLHGNSVDTCGSLVPQTSPQKVTNNVNGLRTASSVSKTNGSNTSSVACNKLQVSAGKIKHAVSFADKNQGVSSVTEVDHGSSGVNAIVSRGQNKAGKDVGAKSLHQIHTENAKGAPSTTVNDRVHIQPCSSSSASSPHQRTAFVDADSSSSDGHQTLDRSWFAKEPSFTCPVCCKPINCINLTDFNAHIDKCLQISSEQCPTPDSRPSLGTRLSNSSQPSLKSVRSGPTSSPQNSTCKKTKHSPSSVKISSSQSQSAVTRNPSVIYDNSIRSCDINDKKPHSSNSSACQRPSSENLLLLDETSLISHTPDSDSSAQADISEVGSGRSLSNLQTGCADDLVSGNTSHSRQTELESPDYMVCPLCSAERADWTLETFNQHVDACLNRDTIAQILQEQRTSEELPRKRPASSQQEENSRSSQQGKKAKKNRSALPERSILSFFKT